MAANVFFNTDNTSSTLPTLAPLKHLEDFEVVATLEVSLGHAGM